MEVVTKLAIITKQVLNETTGELESKVFKEEKTRTTIRGGFNLMYHKSYEQVIESVMRSNTDTKLFNWITNQFTYQKVEVPLIYADCEIKVAQSKFSTFVKRLLDEGYLMRVSRGVYRLNPFIYIPFKANGPELQSQWNEIKQAKK
jgi:hypothetical protein